MQKERKKERKKEGEKERSRCTQREVENDCALQAKYFERTISSITKKPKDLMSYN